ncbi:MAG: glutaredoxin family protein [Actinomycetota bacterium]|nr:glutaredoxin family protein [Actinomycetota bacterium]
MEMNHVDGKNVGEVVLYAISTCPWCGKTKGLLSDLGVEYSYIDVDLVPKEEGKRVAQEVARWNEKLSFPTLVIDGERVIVGFKEDEIKEALGGSQ